MRVDDTLFPSTSGSESKKPHLKICNVVPSVPGGTDAYLMESGDYYLMESGDKYLLE